MAPGNPTLLNPVRKTLWPVMKAERPAVQLWLGVVVRELHPLARDAVDVGCGIAHQPLGVRAEVADADVVAPDHDDVGLTLRFGRGSVAGLATGTRRSRVRFRS